jgi:hypothetical protein
MLSKKRVVHIELDIYVFIYNCNKRYYIVYEKVTTDRKYSEFEINWLDCNSFSFVVIHFRLYIHGITVTVQQKPSYIS